ncbi:MAG TPA: META domain-containing protein [Candidatus Nanopelagicales bacterium]
MAHRTTPAVALVGSALLVPALLAGCSSSDDTTSTTPTAAASAAASAVPGGGNATAPLPTGGAELASTTWALSGLATSTDDVSGSGITLDFAAAEASGNAGVNTYNATYTSSADGTLTFSAIASTKMAGDEAAMKLEAEYLDMLGKVTGYSVSNGLLDLFVGPDQMLTFTAA